MLFRSIDGFITQINVSLGMSVAPEQVIYKVVDRSHMHLELKVFEKDIHKVEEGQKVLFTVPVAGVEEMGATVYLKGKVFEEDTRTLGVHCHLHKEYKDIVPGMYVNATIFCNAANANTLQEKSLIREGDKIFAYINVSKQGDKTASFEKIEVTIGKKREGTVEIISPETILTSTQIVKEGVYDLNAELNRAGEEE